GPGLPRVGVGTVAGVAAAFAWRGEIFRLRFESEGMARWYAAAYSADEAALSLAPLERRRTTVHVTNTGRRPWTISEGFHLSYHWYDLGGRPMGDGPRMALPHDVAPGEAVVLEARVEAPAAEGRYALRWALGPGPTPGFRGGGVPGEAVAVAVPRGGPLPATTAALRLPPWTPPWRPSRAELWGLAAGMWREHPWLGVGSDNYRRLYGLRSGHTLWDDRVFANNTLLEAAATTGSLGVLALAGTFLAALLGAWRGLAVAGRLEAALGETALGALAGLAAHGMVDYVLAFTGHYVFFGFVVGVVSSFKRRPSERPGFERDASRSAPAGTCE